MVGCGRKMVDKAAAQWSKCAPQVFVVFFSSGPTQVIFSLARLFNSSFCYLFSALSLHFTSFIQSFYTTVSESIIPNGTLANHSLVNLLLTIV
jgi:hypothetical protein